MNRTYKKVLINIDWLLVTEYPEKVSKGYDIPENCNTHAHIILSTEVDPRTIEYFIQMAFKKVVDVDIKRIDKRDDKYNSVEYLLKQKHIMTDENYNYKIG